MKKHMSTYAHVHIELMPNEIKGAYNSIDISEILQFLSSQLIEMKSFVFVVLCLIAVSSETVKGKYCNWI